MAVPEITKETQEYYAKLFYFYGQNRTPTQYSDMLMSVKNFISCFPNQEEKTKELMNIYYDPIKYVLNKHSTVFNKNRTKRINLTKSLPEIDWIYYRDTMRPTKLTKTYHINPKKVLFSKNLTLSDIVMILGLVKLSISEVFTDVARMNKFNFDFDVPTNTGITIQQVGDV